MILLFICEHRLGTFEVATFRGSLLSGGGVLLSGVSLFSWGSLLSGRSLLSGGVASFGGGGGRYLRGGPFGGR